MNKLTAHFIKSITRIIIYILAFMFITTTLAKCIWNDIPPVVAFLCGFFAGIFGYYIEAFNVLDPIPLDNDEY